MKLSIIVAIANNNGIGYRNSLPWKHVSSDMKHFKAVTQGGVVLMGRNTWDSLPRKPLPERTNIIMTTRSFDDYNDDEVVTLRGIDMVDIMRLIGDAYPDEEVFVIGGAQVYNMFFPYVDKVYLTRIDADVQADTFLPVDDIMTQHGPFTLVEEESLFDTYNVRFEVWEKN